MSSWTRFRISPREGGVNKRLAVRCWNKFSMTVYFGLLYRSMKRGNVVTRSPLTTQNSKICGHLSHRRHLRAIIEWWVSWQLTLKTQKPTAMRWVLWFLGHFNAKTPHQNTAFSPLFAKNAKTEYANYNNINALHFCILQFTFFTNQKGW